MKIRTILALAAIFHLAQVFAQKQDKGVLILTLGTDTTFIHQFEIRGDSVFSKILSMPGGLRLTDGRGRLFPNGNLQSMASKAYQPTVNGAWQVIAETTLRTTPDSTFIQLVNREGKITNRSFAGHAVVTNSADPASFQLFPYYAFHAPATVGDSVLLRHVSPIGARDFQLKRVDKNTVRIGSSFMGKITLTVDDQNRLQSVDALGSSLNFTAKAYRGLDFEAISRRLAQHHALGTAPLVVSTRDTVEFWQGAQNIRINYWRPSARGRKIFGQIVPPGSFWRLGANNATEIALSQPVFFGDKKLPAGKYTLFAMPESDGRWVLLVNRKTGIWGTEYDPKADVLRVPMQVENLAEHVEKLTIAILHAPSNGGILDIRWEKTRLFLPFRSEAVPLEPNAGFAPSEGCNVFYKIVGKGRPVLIVNGGPGMDSEGFMQFAEMLADTCQAIVFDQRGTGRSRLASTDSTTVTMDLMVTDMENLRRHLGIRTWTVLGHSFGGLLAASYAAKYPERTAALIFSSSGGLDLDFMGYVGQSQLARFSKAERDTLEYLTNRIMAGDTSLQTLQRRAYALAPAYVFDRQHVPAIAQRLLQINFLVNTLVFQDLMRIRYDTKPKLSQYKKPVLIIQGKQDIILERTAELAGQIMPQAKVVLLDNCAHYGWLEAKGRYLEEIRAFLK